MGYYEEFWDHVDVRGPDDCWEWMEARQPLQRRHVGAAWRGGYGLVFDPRRKRSRGAHCVAWELHHGVEIPPGVVIRHRCDNPPCCNPAHLLSGTHGANRLDAVERGRAGDSTPHHIQFGTLSKNARLTEAIVSEARRRAANGDPVLHLAKEYDVAFATMWSAIRGRSWKHVAL